MKCSYVDHWSLAVTLHSQHHEEFLAHKKLEQCQSSVGSPDCRCYHGVRVGQRVDCCVRPNWNNCSCISDAYRSGTEHVARRLPHQCRPTDRAATNRSLPSQHWHRHRCCAPESSAICGQFWSHHRDFQESHGRSLLLLSSAARDELRRRHAISSYAPDCHHRWIRIQTICTYRTHGFSR
jgi:hypothetical protein